MGLFSVPKPKIWNTHGDWAAYVRCPSKCGLGFFKPDAVPDVCPHCGEWNDRGASKLAARPIYQNEFVGYYCLERLSHYELKEKGEN